jgi:hypothetical protein
MSRRIKVLLWILSFVVVAAVSAPFVFRALIFDTKYADAFSRERFHGIQAGSTLKTVLSQVGQPLDVLFCDAPVEERRWLRAAGILDSLVTNEQAYVIRYSAPREDGGSFRAYEVWFRSGRVEQTRVFHHWD